MSQQDTWTLVLYRKPSGRTTQRRLEFNIISYEEPPDCTSDIVRVSQWIARSRDEKRNLVVLIERKLKVVFGKAPDKGLQQISRSFSQAGNRGEALETLLSMWERAKCSKQSITALRHDTKTHGKFEVANAKVDQWIGNFMTGFAEFYDHTHRDGPRYSKNNERWLHGILRATRLASELASTQTDFS
ncbi:hypothetical protein O9K51_10747 [Purpureocillium lavendulum]|uniref:Uncharacterized protein n=1 Tax=Purpureocillium lavendulum TaxID=1247861 RepID=A0AB34FBQ6_9HYPO|nr:hypothetical protein O9K51_10747 [Purpureocillium lavendulum]